MNAINEAELVDFVKNQAVKRLRIIQSDSGKYQTVVNLTWKDGDWQLVTTRAKPREWVSLDRLARHICEKYQGQLPTITLSFNSVFLNLTEK